MQESSPAAAEVLESSEREFAHRLLIDWSRTGDYDHPLSDLSGYVSRTVRDQSLSSTAPEDLQLIEGYAAAKLTVEAAGTYDGMSLAAHFAPYNGLSAFYATGIPLGVAGVYDISVATAGGWETWRQFTGLVRDIAIDRASGLVTIELLDNVENLRTSVDIPPYGLWQKYLQDGQKRGMLTDSSSILDLAARSGRFTMGPEPFIVWPYDSAPDAGEILSVPLHGSVLPEIGTLDNYQEFHRTEQWENSELAEERDHAEAYIAGPHGYLAHQRVPDTASGAANNSTVYWCDDAREVAGSIAGTWILAAWVHYDGDKTQVGWSQVLDVQIRGNQMRMILECETGRIYCELQEHSGGPLHFGPSRTMPGHGWHYVEVGFEVQSSPAGIRMRTRVNDDMGPITTVASTWPDDVNDALSGLITIGKDYSISDVLVFEGDYYNGLGGSVRDLTPLGTARMDWGRNRITYTLRESGLEAWQLATDVAAAEYGAVFCDEFGRLTFWNYDTIEAAQDTVVRTFTIDTLSRLGLRNALDSVRNVWTVTTTAGRAKDATVYDLGPDGVPLDEAANGELYPHSFIVPANYSIALFVPVDDHTISVDPGQLPHPPDFSIWDQYVPEHGCISYTGADQRSTGPGTEQKMVTRDLFRQWLANVWDNDPVGFVSPAGQPRFRVGGTRVFEDAPRTWTIRDQSSIDRHGERVIELGQSFWLQDQWQTRAMLRKIVDRMGRPIPISDAVTVPMDPRTQLCDTVAFQDPGGFGADMRLQLYGIRRELSTEGATDTYSIEMVHPPAAVGIWDDPTYGIWDQSFIWSE